MRRSCILILLSIPGVTLAILPLARGGNDAGPRVGAAPPEFRLQDQDGREVSLSQFRNRIVVLEWTDPDPRCLEVRRLARAKVMKTLAERYRPRGVAWLAINSSATSTPAANKRWAVADGLPYPVLDDAKGAAGHAYGVSLAPHLFVIDKDQLLAYAGGIDNDPQQNKGEGKINFVERALDELLAGKHVSYAQTPAYGCPVEYANK